MADIVGQAAGLAYYYNPAMPENFTHGYALVIGVASYPHIRPLPFTVLNDAADIADMLKRPDRAGYVADHVRLLLDEQATKAAMLDGLKWLAEQTTGESTAVVFFSGHGGRVNEGGAAVNYLLPYNTKADALKETAIRSDELTDALRAIHAGRLVVILDACHSGGAGEAKDALAPDVEVVKGNPTDDLYEELRRGEGRVILASCRSVELSYVLPNARNSLFTQCLLEAIDGRARHRGDGTVRIFDLAEYVMEEVPARYHRRQHPIFKAQDVDANFPVTLLMGGDKSLAPAPPLTPLNTSVDRTALREFLVAHKTLDELDILCADIEQELEHDGIKLRVSLDTVGIGRRATVQYAALNLIDYLRRNGRLAYLVRRLRKEYPGEI